MGRIAYNTHGIRGIYARGEFYTLIDPARQPETDPDFLCHEARNHAEHICQLKKQREGKAVKDLAKDPRISCLLCEALANSAEYVCSPVELT